MIHDPRRFIVFFLSFFRPFLLPLEPPHQLLGSSGAEYSDTGVFRDTYRAWGLYAPPPVHMIGAGYRPAKHDRHVTILRTVRGDTNDVWNRSVDSLALPSARRTCCCCEWLSIRIHLSVCLSVSIMPAPCRLPPRCPLIDCLRPRCSSSPPISQCGWQGGGWVHSPNGLGRIRTPTITTLGSPVEYSASPAQSRQSHPFQSYNTTPRPLVGLVRLDRMRV